MSEKDPQPIIFHPDPFDSARIGEIEWDEARIRVHHGNGFPLDPMLTVDHENALLYRIFLSKNATARALDVNYHTFHSRTRVALNRMRAPFVRTAIAPLFDPEKGIMETVTPHRLPEAPTQEEAALYRILSTARSYEAGSETAWHWDTVDKIKGAVSELIQNMGVTDEAITFHGFAAHILGPGEPVIDETAGGPPTYRQFGRRRPVIKQQWSPPPRAGSPPNASVSPDGFSITHPRNPNDDNLYLPTGQLLPLDAALIFEGRNWWSAHITAIRAREGVVRINRGHELAHELGEEALRYLGAASLGLRRRAREEALYLEAGAGTPLRRKLADTLELDHDRPMHQVLEQSFQRRLIEVETPANFDLSTLLRIRPQSEEVIRRVAQGYRHVEAACIGVPPNTHKAQRTYDDIHAAMQIEGGGIITMGHLKGILSV